MGKQNRNRYCTRCGKTTQFQIERDVYTCSTCGVRVVVQRQGDSARVLWGDPFEFRTRFT